MHRRLGSMAHYNGVYYEKKKHTPDENLINKLKMIIQEEGNILNLTTRIW